MDNGDIVHFISIYFTHEIQQDEKQYFYQP